MNKVIKLNPKNTNYRVWNKEHKEWFRLEVEESMRYPLNTFLKSETSDKLYLGSSLKSAPWIWGEIEECGE